MATAVVLDCFDQIAGKNLEKQRKTMDDAPTRRIFNALSSRCTDQTKEKNLKVFHLVGQDGQPMLRGLR